MPREVRYSCLSSCNVETAKFNGQSRISYIFSRVNFIQRRAGKLKSFAGSQIQPYLRGIHNFVILMKCSLNNLLRNFIFI
jgi:hypothetical protein